MRSYGQDDVTFLMVMLVCQEIKFFLGYQGELCCPSVVYCYSCLQLGMTSVWYIYKDGHQKALKKRTFLNGKPSYNIIKTCEK
jgi:hypothetical protein